MHFTANRDGHVYFVQNLADQLIKIGFSGDVPKRMKDLASHHHAPMRLLAAIDGCSVFDERRLHHRFRGLRARNAYGTEWFRPEPKLILFILRKTLGSLPDVQPAIGRPWSHERRQRHYARSA